MYRVPNKGIFNSQVEGQDSLRSAIMITLIKAMKSKSKKQFQHGVRIDFSLQQGDLAMIQGKGEEKQGFILSVPPLTYSCFVSLSKSSLLLI